MGHQERFTGGKWYQLETPTSGALPPSMDGMGWLLPVTPYGAQQGPPFGSTHLQGGP